MSTRKTFDEIFEDKTKFGTKIKTNEYHTAGKHIIIDQGQEQIAGYTDREAGLFTDIPAIIFGDHTRVIKYVDEPFFLGADGVKVLRCKYVDANYKYLYYALKNARIPDTGYNRHFKWLKEVQIPYREAASQAEITQVLDGVAEIISKREQEVSAFNDLIKARFVEMFGDPVSNPKGLPLCELSKLGLLERGRSKHRPRNAPELLGGPYPLVQTGEVSSAGLYITSYSQTYSKLGLQQSRMWKAGTLCVTIAANIAQTAILAFDACFPDSVVGFTTNGQMEPIYLHYWFTFFQKILEDQAPQVAQKNINLEILSNLQVIVPEVEQQKEFISFVTQANKSKVAVQKALDEAQLLFDSLMQTYFG